MIPVLNRLFTGELKRLVLVWHPRNVVLLRPLEERLIIYYVQILSEKYFVILKRPTMV